MEGYWVLKEGFVYGHDTIEKMGEREKKPLLNDKLFFSMEIKYNYFYNNYFIF